MLFGSHTFVLISWMCKKQTSVSHSSTESEIVSLDAGLRMDGILALDLWDLVIEVLSSSPHQAQRNQELVRGDPLLNKSTRKTHQRTNQDSNYEEMSRVFQCRLCFLKREIFSSRCHTLQF